MWQYFVSPESTPAKDPNKIDTLQKRISKIANFIRNPGCCNTTLKPAKFVADVNLVQSFD